MTTYHVGRPPEAPVAPKRRWPLYAGIAGAVLLLAAGAATAGILTARHDGSVAAAPTSSVRTPATVTSTAATVADEHGKRACDLNHLAAENLTPLTKDAVSQILAEAKLSTDESIRFRAQMLSDRQRLADAAKGHSDEAARAIEAVSASIELETACVRAHLE